MNKKGFTLIELLATLVILGLVMGIASYSIISIINNAKKKNYELLVNNIKGGAEVFYQECRFSMDTVVSMVGGNTTLANNLCKKSGNSYTVTIGDLVKYGYVKGNKSNNDGTSSIVNTNTDEDISACVIKVAYTNDKIVITSNSTASKCPKEY